MDATLSAKEKKMVVPNHILQLFCKVLYVKTKWSVYEHKCSIYLRVLWVCERRCSILQHTPMQYDVIQPHAYQHVYRVPQFPLFDVEQEGNVLRTMGVSATYGIHHLIDDHFPSWLSCVIHLHHALYNMVHRKEIRYARCRLQLGRKKQADTSQRGLAFLMTKEVGKRKRQGQFYRKMTFRPPLTYNLPLIGSPTRCPYRS